MKVCCSITRRCFPQLVKLFCLHKGARLGNYKQNRCKKYLWLYSTEITFDKFRGPTNALIVITGFLGSSICPGITEISRYFEASGAQGAPITGLSVLSVALSKGTKKRSGTKNNNQFLLFCNFCVIFSLTFCK